MNIVSQFTGFKSKQQEKSTTPAKTVKDWQPGEKLVGFWQQDREFEGQHGKLIYHYLIKAQIDRKGNITTNDEMISLRSGAGLANQLRDLKPGQLIELTYEGRVKNTKSGQMFHKFSSQVAENFYIKQRDNDDEYLDWGSEDV